MCAVEPGNILNASHTGAVLTVSTPRVSEVYMVMLISAGIDPLQQKIVTVISIEISTETGAIIL